LGFRTARSDGSKLRMVGTLALILTFSPGERVNRSPVLWNVVRWYWQEVIEQSEDGRCRLPLREERAGVREVVKHSYTRWKSGGEHARTPDASRGSRKPGSREAFGLRVSLAPLSDVARNSTQLVSPKSDSSRWDQTCRAEIRWRRMKAEGAGKTGKFLHESPDRDDRMIHSL
jgi:hypothetical protein